MATVTVNANELFNDLTLKKAPQERDSYETSYSNCHSVLVKGALISSLHCNISLSLCSFSYNGVCFGRLKLSADDTIVSQNGSNGDGKLQFYGRDSNFP